MFLFSCEQAFGQEGRQRGKLKTLISLKYYHFNVGWTFILSTPTYFQPAHFQLFILNSPSALQPSPTIGRRRLVVPIHEPPNFYPELNNLPPTFSSQSTYGQRCLTVRLTISQTLTSYLELGDLWLYHRMTKGQSVITSAQIWIKPSVSHEFYKTRHLMILFCRYVKVWKSNTAKLHSF